MLYFLANINIVYMGNNKFNVLMRHLKMNDDICKWGILGKIVLSCRNKLTA